MADIASIPVNLITGYLGSGKTTVLRHILSSPAFTRSLVLINEFGEIGLDHIIVGSAGKASVLLENGCICCAVRDDFRKALLDAFDTRNDVASAPFERVFLETTGVADAVPIIATVMNDSVLRHHYRLGNVVTTVDAVHAAETLERDAVALKQIAVADRILLTKCDLTDAAGVEHLRARIAGLNPSVQAIPVLNGEVDPESLIGQDLYDPATKSAEVSTWLKHYKTNETARQARRLRLGSERENPAFIAEQIVGPHPGDLRSVAIELQDPVDWNAFGLWLTLVVHQHGERILRFKAIVNVLGNEEPVVLHGVQSLLHPAEHLPAWPTGEQTTRIVMIVRGLDPALVERSLRTFLALGGKLDS